MFFEFIKRDGGKRSNAKLASILSLFRNGFNKINKTRARMLDSIKINLKSHFSVTLLS